MSVLCGVRVGDGIDIGAIVAQTLHDCQMQHKEAYLVCGIDGASWSRSLRGEQPIDLWKIRLLPIRWWQAFLPKLASALIVAWWDEQTGERQMVRAETTEQERKRA